MLELGLSQTISLKLREIWVFLPGDYEFDTFTVSRNNDDVSIIFFGQQLLKLCIAAKLRFLNGRTRGDLQGHFSYFCLQECITVDLVLASKSLLKPSFIQYLSVQDLHLLSDHKPILLKISNNNLLETNKNSANYILKGRPLKYHWDNSLEEGYEKHLTDKSNHFIRHYENVSSDCRSNINSVIEDIIVIIISSKRLYTHCR